MALFTTISPLLIPYSFRARTLDFFAFSKTPGGCLAPKYRYLHDCLQIAYKLQIYFIDSRLVLTLIRNILGFTISQIFCNRLRYKVFTKWVPLISYYSFWNNPIWDNHVYQLLCSCCPCFAPARAERSSRCGCISFSFSYLGYQSHFGQVESLLSWLWEDASRSSQAIC